MQRAFKEQAQSLVEVINQMGNPFLHDSAELLRLDTRDVLDESVVRTVRCVEKLDMEQYRAYNECVIKDRSTSIHEVIKKTYCHSLAIQHLRQKASRLSRSQC